MTSDILDLEGLVQSEPRLGRLPDSDHGGSLPVLLGEGLPEPNHCHTRQADVSNAIGHSSCARYQRSTYQHETTRGVHRPVAVRLRTRKVHASQCIDALADFILCSKLSTHSLPHILRSSPSALSLLLSKSCSPLASRRSNKIYGTSRAEETSRLASKLFLGRHQFRLTLVI